MNWGGDEGVPVPEMVDYVATRLGREAKVDAGPDGIHQYWLDPAKRVQLAGPCRVPWREGIDRLIAARHPDLELG